MRPAALALTLLLATACASPRARLERLPDAEITVADDVEAVLLGQWLMTMWMLDVAPEHPVDPSQPRPPEQPPCPAPLKLGNTTIWLGDCVDARGDEWHGAKSIRRRPAKLGVGFRVFSSDGPEEQTTGRVRIWTDGDATRFSIRMWFIDEDDEVLLDYEGHTTVDLLAPDFDLDAPGEWSGRGTLATAELGKVEILEVAKRIDRSVCSTEPLSGLTQMRAGGHTIVIRYDGAGACDPKGLAPWSLDGVEMGQLDPMPSLCAVEPDAPAWPGLLALGLMVGAATRRRARTDRWR